jgi:uncharacterized membrane protein YdbT with pleckstrin-like domain
MAYIDDLLGRGEHIIHVGRQHAFVLISNVLTELLLIAILIAAGVASQSAFPQGATVLGAGSMTFGQLVLIVCALISLFILISAFVDYLRWNNETYIITDMRVIQLRGVFNKGVIDSSLDKINDIELRQSWLGRIFDFGDIEILTASEAGVNLMRRLAHPLHFKRALLEAKQNHRSGFGYLDPQAVAAYTQAQHAQQAARPAGGRPEIEQTLHTLAELRDQGILSQDEFEAKKRDLLSRI